MRRISRAVLGGATVVVAAGVAGAVPAASAAKAASDEPTVVVESDTRVAPISAVLTGVNNNEWFDNSNGLWDAEAGRPDPVAAAQTASAGVNLVRYPGGTSANLFDWKRAIGPQDERSCQRDGRPGGLPQDSVYGPDEHMQFVSEADASAQILVSFANGSPEDAADWVEYMNAPVGSNPRGGVAWAQARADTGHPEPYGVTYWEVGNEHDRNGNQRYWLNRDDMDLAMRQYAFGGTQRQDHTDVGQQLGKGCDFRPELASDGSPGQVFEVRFPPIVPDSATVWVDGVEWREVPDLAAAGPEEQVFEVAPEEGEIVFGDGVHGAIPPEGAEVEADYDSGPHPGFVDFYAAMKEADPDIDVCAIWGEPDFPPLMAEAGYADWYDCLTVHPYTNFRRDFVDDWTTAQEGHDEHMLGEATQTERLERVIAAVDAHADADTYVAVSEFGALWFGNHDRSAYERWDTAMSHALYMASQWTRFANAGLPWAEGNTLVPGAPNGTRAVLGGPPEFIHNSEAVVRTQLRPVVEGGGDVVANKVVNNPVISTDPTPLGSAYDALTSTATIDDGGRLQIVVVNRHATEPVTARVVPAGYQHQPDVDVSTVSGDHFTSHNSRENRDDVRIESSTHRAAPGAFRYAFPAHSVTVLRLEPAE